MIVQKFEVIKAIFIQKKHLSKYFLSNFITNVIVYTSYKKKRINSIINIQLFNFYENSFNKQEYLSIK